MNRYVNLSGHQAQQVNKSMVLDQSQFVSNQTSIVKNFDTSFSFQGLNSSKHGNGQAILKNQRNNSSQKQAKKKQQTLRKSVNQY